MTYCAGAVPRSEAARSQWHSAYILVEQTAQQLLPPFLLLLTLLAAMDSAGSPLRAGATYGSVSDATRALWSKLGMAVNWNMFDSPPDRCGWYVLPARMKDGTLIDAHKLHHEPGENPQLTWKRPEYPAFQHRSSLWHSFYERLYAEVAEDAAQMEFLLESLARFYCRRYPIRVINIILSQEFYNFTTKHDGELDGRIVWNNQTLWGKACEPYDQTGRKPKKTLVPTRPRLAPNKF
jgi:hypothetical protein